jgi:hypothetical protein
LPEVRQARRRAQAEREHHGQVLRPLSLLRLHDVKQRRAEQCRCDMEPAEPERRHPMNNLQERRVFLGLTQPDVSRELRKVDPRMDVGMVSRFERGACLPTAAVLKRLTEVLQASVSDLYGAEDMAVWKNGTAEK